MTTQASPFRTRIGAGLLGSRASRRPRQQSGIALITTLLLLILLSLLGLTMAVTANSDMMINGYYGSYRGSFYAADSGLNIARATMINSIQGAVSLTPCAAWGPTGASGCTEATATGPLNGTTAASAALTAITTTSFGSLNVGQAANSWPENYIIPSSITGCTTNVAFPTAGVTNPQILTTSGGLPTSYAYTFNYTLCAVGRAQASQQVATKEIGTLIFNVTAQSSTSTPTTTSFADFGAFIDNFPECNGPLVTGTITGPVFTNGSWNFGSGGSYIFTDPVGQNDPNASFIFGGGGGAPSCGGNSGCDCKNASSDSYNGTTIAPTFQAGFNRNQPKAPLPVNDFSQKWAVIDGYGYNGAGHLEPVANPGATQFNTYLKDVNGNAYPSGGASSGVFMPYCTGGSSCTTPNTILGGGFYIEDSSSITTNIQVTLGTSGGNPTQTYTITQINGGTTTTTAITLNINANTTTIQQTSPSPKTVTLAGVPINQAITSPREGALLYVNGKINSLNGAGQATASLQDYYGTTIAANGDIDVTGDLIYKHEPVTLNPSDTLVNGNDYNQVLGIYTNNGNIVLSVPGSYSPQNLETDAVVAAINSSCPGGSSSCGLGSSSFNTWTIVGGRIESNVHGVGYSTRNTWFDRRFTSRTDGFAPPWFPSTTVAQNDTTTATAPLVAPSTQRLTWVTWPQ